MKNILIPSNLLYFKNVGSYFNTSEFKIFYYGSNKDLKKSKNNLNLGEILEKSVTDHKSLKFKNKKLKNKYKKLKYLKKIFFLVSRRVYYGKKYDIELLFEHSISEILIFLKKNKINFVFFHSTPHLPSSIGLYYCCKILKIKTFIFYKTSFDYLFIVKKDWYTSFIYSFKNPIKELKNLYNFKKKSKSIQIVKDLNKKDFISTNFLEIFYYLIKRIIKLIFLKDRINRDSYFYYVKNKHKFYEIKLLIYFIVKKLFNKLLYNFYFSTKTINFNKNFIYFSLGIEPEGTNCPTGGMFHDQIKAVKLISKSINKDMFIYVKEHPAQFHIKDMPLDAYFYKNLNYYKKLKKIKNVILLKSNTRSEDCIKNAKLTCTISSTAGWESIATGKRSIVFSNTWYSGHKNCLVVNDTSILTVKKIKNFIYKDINVLNIKNENEQFINNLGNKLLFAHIWPRLDTPKNLKKMTLNFFRKITEII